MLGFALAGAVPAWHGGGFQESWAWTALLTLLASSILIIARGRLGSSVLELCFVAALAGFTGWLTLSALWSDSATSTLLETQRMLAYVGAVSLAIVVVRRQAVVALLAGALAGVVAVCSYALLTRLLPERLGSFDSVTNYRLSAPVGYWNGLGSYAAMGSLLALALAARSQHPVARALAGASTVPLVVAMYFTFSRGSWLAVAIGLVAAVALDPRRLQLVGVGSSLALVAGTAVVAASRSDALTTRGSTLGAAAHAGHRLLPVVLLLSLAAGVVSYVWAVCERRIEIGRALRKMLTSGLVAVVLLGVGAVWVHSGSPWHLAETSWRSFNTEPAPTTLSGRLFALSSRARVDLWRVAWSDFREQPLTGTGAGTYSQSWLQHRPNDAPATNAHSLYLETLAELGVPGLVLLLLVLAIPVAAMRLVRSEPFAVPAFAVYVAWLAHMAVDWDWKLVGVSLVPLLVAIALLASTRTRKTSVTTPWRAAIAAVAAALTAVAFVGFMSNVPLGRARTALEQGDWRLATDQASNAKPWAPWSSQPWQSLGEGQLALGDRVAARRSFTEALADDPRSWQLWLDYSLVTTGADQRHALAMAGRLNPLEPLVGVARSDLLQTQQR